jgi:type VI secretion system protein
VAITLRLAGGGLSGPSQTKLLTSGTLSIGRGPGNDWVLPDPDRHLSKTHCVISIENGRPVLTDLSTNGVHINGARQATARDSRTVLTDGDDFRLGDYTISVSEVEDARPAAYGGGGTVADPFGARGGDPFEAGAGPEEGRSPLEVDPLDDPLGRPPDPGFRHPVAHRAAGPRPEDPFDVAEERARRDVDPDADLFRGVKPTVEWQGPTQADHADAPQHAFAAPRILPSTDPNAIDFDALIGDIAPPAPPRPAPGQAHPVRPPAPAARDPFADLDGLLPPDPKPAPPPVARTIEPAPLPADPFADVPPPPPAPPPPVAAPRPPLAAAPRAVEDPFAEVDRPAPPPRPTPAPPAPAPSAAAGDARAGLQAFLEGAGVANLPLAASTDPEATLRAVGEVFRAMTEGLREVLMSRAAIKGDMRVEQTMIQARNNNALKFSVTPDDAVAALLLKDRPGYMPPLAATKEAFNDIKSHELAVMAGIQTALMGLLQRFDPATLEKRLAQGLLASVLPGARKARYWDSFCEVYGQIAREAEDDFQAVFGKAFAKAYTAQTRKEP